ncbi:MAG TPA: Ig-like domain-containing protein [Prolixibacteraceae bacterium]|nr:Ig-like domain-containing protein [Prolixibacteraceae bacterium]
MNIIKNIPLIIVLALAWATVVSSCANQGMPTGGPQDSIPPLLISTYPDYKELNYTGDEVRLTFNEYIAIDDVRDKLVVSPPLDERPVIRTKSRTLIIQFNEDLKDSTTYSLDFKNSVVDNNERNEYKNLRFSFSTGSTYDSLRVAGRVLDAFDLEPKENVLVMLHSNLHDSAVYTVVPDYIARTDENGLFLMDNVAEDTYHIFSITDNNNDLMYNEGAEEIAFTDTIVVPGAEYIADPDTLVKGADSLLISGHTQYYPDPFYLRQFGEDLFEQYVKKIERNTRTQGTFVFNESVKDTLGVRLLNRDYAVEWYMLEQNENVDSIIYWITDSLVYQSDTLLTELSYFQLDELQQLYLKRDTFELTFTDSEKDTKKEKRKKDTEENEPEPIEQFSFQTNLSTSLFDINKDIILTTPNPLDTINISQIHLYLRDDTIKTPLQYNFSKDTTAWRTYRLAYNWEASTDYSLEIDSAASATIYGITNKELTKKFSTRDEDYYGIINLKLNNVKVPMIIQLLENTDNEKVVAERFADEDETVVFDFLPPNKYKIKAIFDANGNKKWDSGSFQDGLLPEKVAYINEVTKVRSNWDNNLVWDLTPDPSYYKNIRDREMEEQLRKEAEEKAREQRQNPQRQQSNPMQRGQGMGGSGLIRR